MPTLKTFLLKLTVLTVVLMGAEWATFRYGMDFEMTLAFWLSFAWFFGITLLVHIMLLRAGEKDAKKFVPVFMGMVGLKMFISLGMLMAYLALVEESVKSFAVAFLVQYIAYTVLEVTSVLKALKNKG